MWLTGSDGRTIATIIPPEGGFGEALITEGRIQALSAGTQLVFPDGDNRYQLAVGEVDLIVSAQPKFAGAYISRDDAGKVTVEGLDADAGSGMHSDDAKLAITPPAGQTVQIDLDGSMSAPEGSTVLVNHGDVNSDYYFNIKLGADAVVTPVIEGSNYISTEISTEDYELEALSDETLALKNNGVSDTIITLPEGATATIGENGLTVPAGSIVSSPYGGTVTVTEPTVIKPQSYIPLPETHPINIAQPVGGSVDTNFSNASAGSVITVTATPEEGYTLLYVTVDGEKIDGLSFKMPDHAVTVSAVFTRGLPFTDVADGGWFYDYIAYVYANGLMEGVSATEFNPDGTMTRAMFWAVLARIDGETVTGAGWMDEARAWAVTSGVSDGTNANAEITRQEMVTMLYRFAGSPAVTGSLSGYTDASSVASWATDAMTWAVTNGVITGASETTLAPGANATRAQAAAILMRFAEA